MKQHRFPFPCRRPYLPAMSSCIRSAMKGPLNAKHTPAELAKRMSRRVDVERCLRGGWCHQLTHL